MATNANRDSGDIPLIEEQVDTGLAELLDGYRSEFANTNSKKDELAKRFILKPSQPIPELSHAFAKAYVAEDTFNTSRMVFAMVLENHIPCRQHLTNELTAFSHPHLVQLLGSGIINCSHLNESRLVLFFERPAGKLLSEAMKETPRLHEHLVSDYIIGPATKALSALRDKKVSHGNLGPSSFFMGETPVINECISAPCGTLTHHIYQPIEIMMTDPLGRGEADEKTDVYAIGILALELAYGINRQKTLSREDLSRLILTKGSYRALVGNHDIATNFADMLHGLLNDNPQDRWGLDQLMQWIRGKRFNIIPPTIGQSRSHPFVFGGDSYFDPRLIAHNLQRQWHTTAKDLKNLRLDRWVDTYLHRPEMAEKIRRAIRMGGDGTNEMAIDNMISRAASALDPTGPIRSMSLSVRPDGIGTLLAKFMADNSINELTQLTFLINAELSDYWVELTPEGRGRDYSQILWKLQKAKQSLQQKGLGFGIERVLYDLNPALSCQSPLLKQYCVPDVVEVLKALDAIAKNMAPDTSFSDRHLAAFVASKASINTELWLSELNALPALSKNAELIVLRLLAKAQQKHSALQLPGLCAWAAIRVDKMLDSIHNRVVRKELKLKLRNLAQQGSLSYLLNSVINRNITIHDYKGFARAIAMHQINSNKIERFENPLLVDYYARNMGGKISMTIAYVVLMITSYQVLTDILGIE